MPNVSFEPLQSLFDDGQGITKELFKADALDKFKQENLSGVPESRLQITFSSEEGDDILIEKIDPEKALGYSVYAGENDYFDRLSAELYEPSEEEVMGGLNG